MRHLVACALAALLVGAAVLVPLAAPRAQSTTWVKVQDDVRVPRAKRLGLNLGSHSRWGAAQLLQNVIVNPGFEAGVFGMVSHAVAGATGQRFPRDGWDPAWNNEQLGIGQPEGFWDGADYEIVFGSGVGRQGMVTTFAHEGPNYVFYLDGSGPAPRSGDVLVTRTEGPALLGSGAWFAADPAERRPGSPGRQALRLFDPGAAWTNAWYFGMDSYWRDGDRTAGKMLIVEGNWRLSFWAKGARPGEQLQVMFYREGEANFIDRTVTLTDDWQPYQIDVAVAPGRDRVGPYTLTEYHPILIVGLRFPQAGSGAGAWVDDVWLGSTDQQNPTSFRDAFVDRLRELQPGVLRYWGSQLGSTLAEQIAEPWARRANSYSPSVRWASQWSYGLHEFLELCAEVGAEPWCVLPPTLTRAEMAGVAEYLAGPAGAGPWADQRVARGQWVPWTDVFAEIHLEYGNEAWGSNLPGDPFAGASLSGGVRLGTVADDRFAALRASPHYDPGRIRLVIGGQASFPGRQAEIESASSRHDAVGLAPYFGVLNTWETPEEIFLPPFAGALTDVRGGRVEQSAAALRAAGQGTRLAIYENNFHTTSGPAPIGLRNDLLTGVGGIALALRSLYLLDALAVREQCAFSALQYSFRMASGEYARVWGTLRDLVSGRKRPTWLGLELVNHAIVGDLVGTEVLGGRRCWHQRAINGVAVPVTVPYVHAFAFRAGAARGLVLFNLHLRDPAPVRLVLPAAPTGAIAQRWDLVAASISDDNEEAENVRIVASQEVGFAADHALSVAPHSITVLRWADAAGPSVAGATSAWAAAPAPIAIRGAGLDTVTRVDVNGVPAALVAQTPTQLLVQPAAGAPGPVVVHLDALTGRSATTAALLPSLEAIDACVGAMAEFRVTSDGSGLWALVFGSARLPAPVALPGWWHALQVDLSGVVVSGPLSIPAAGSGSLRLRLGASPAPALWGGPLEAQALVVPTSGAAPSFSNAITVTL
ncbi:MAG: hypothetical protein AAF628_15775 [Planctomycetota bacterium]